VGWVKSSLLSGHAIAVDYMCKITIEILEKLHRPSALSSLLDFNHQSHNVGKKSGKNLILASGSDK